MNVLALPKAKAYFMEACNAGLKARSSTDCAKAHYGFY